MPDLEIKDYLKVIAKVGIFLDFDPHKITF
jgi:hypothetical protein